LVSEERMSQAAAAREIELMEEIAKHFEALSQPELF
jgi:hypothetical protein